MVDCHESDEASPQCEIKTNPNASKNSTFCSCNFTAIKHPFRRKLTLVHRIIYFRANDLIIRFFFQWESLLSARSRLMQCQILQEIKKNWKVHGKESATTSVARLAKCSRNANKLSGGMCGQRLCRDQCTWTSFDSCTTAVIDCSPLPIASNELRFFCISLSLRL